jgi:hypothetical protein
MSSVTRRTPCSRPEILKARLERGYFKELSNLINKEIQKTIPEESKQIYEELQSESRANRPKSAPRTSRNNFETVTHYRTTTSQRARPQFAIRFETNHSRQEKEQKLLKSFRLRLQNAEFAMLPKYKNKNVVVPEPRLKLAESPRRMR